jgi:hypothetical protein
MLIHAIFMLIHVDINSTCFRKMNFDIEHINIIEDIISRLDILGDPDCVEGMRQYDSTF